VLEVGAGCGAVTRFLGEVGGDVVAVEGSHRRALIARERTKDLDNVVIVADRINDFGSSQLFDVITVIGVLEYSRIYVKDTSDPEQKLLSHLLRLLKPDGVLMVAIENKLGLKYLAGAHEDHFGIPFAGVNDNYTADSVVTFGELELREHLNAAGFRKQRWYFPCPDYKLPVTILSHRMISEHRELAATLLAQSVVREPQRIDRPSFSLEQAWSVVGKNGLVDKLANSFLVVAGRSTASLANFDQDGSIAWHYTTDRHPAFNKQTRFVLQESGIMVERSRLQEEPTPAVPLECILENEHLIGGSVWWLKLSSIVNKPNWTVRQIADWARIWIDALLHENELAEFNENTIRKRVSGRYLDAIPSNMIYQADGARFIDQEWRSTKDIELGFLTFRGLKDSLSRITSCAVAAPGTSINVNGLISEVFAEFGVKVPRAELDRLSLLELEFHCWVQGHDKEDLSKETITLSRNACLAPRMPLDRRNKKDKWRPWRRRPWT
jgi:SAM-dependent methyltransferase